MAILTNIVNTGRWPSVWKREYGTPIPKEPLPIEGEDQLRIISITNKLSMITEQFIIRWIWPHVCDKVDRNQYGGITSNSVSHYLIEITNFILYNMDLTIPVSTILTMVDFSKGFNKKNHGQLIMELHGMGVPALILRILVSFLTK